MPRMSTAGIVAAWPCTPSYDGATLAARHVQNPVQAGTGDVHNPHTPLPRYFTMCRCATVIWHGLVSTWRPALTIQFRGQERNLATESSLWLAQLYGTVYKQQIVKQTAKLETHLFTLCFNEWQCQSLKHKVNMIILFCISFFICTIFCISFPVPSRKGIITATYFLTYLHARRQDF